MTTPTCTRCQDHLFALEDPAAALPHELAEHLLDCPDCRRVRDDLAHIDESLTFHAAARSGVPTGFKATLLDRLPPPPERITPAQAAYERIDAVRRHQKAIASLEGRYLVPHFRSLPYLLSLMGIVLLAVLGFRELARQLELDPILTMGCGTGLLGLGLAVFHVRSDLFRALQPRRLRAVRSLLFRG